MVSYTTYGKWILAGEHSVLRGHPALVFPLAKKNMEFDYVESTEPLAVHIVGENSNELELIFHGVLEKALHSLKLQRSDLKGQLAIKSSLPLGAGMGGSAALCVGVARFFSEINKIDSDSIYDFARDLEDLFHGESSGVDIAVALEGQALWFQRNLTLGKAASLRKPFQLQIHPNWYLSYSGQKGVTSECVKKVRELHQKSPDRGSVLDLQMNEAVQKAHQALTTNDISKSEALLLLAQSMNQARNCFQEWGLCGGELNRHMNHLLEAGAFAVKPTGSGGGGYVLSLWTQEIPVHLKGELLKV